MVSNVTRALRDPRPRRGMGRPPVLQGARLTACVGDPWAAPQNDNRQTALLLASTTTEDQHYMLRPALAMQHSQCVKALIKAGADLDYQSE